MTHPVASNRCVQFLPGGGGPSIRGMSAPAIPGLTHSMKLRVYYEDTDASGIVYHANYLKFAERGRTEMMRALGFAHSGIAAETGIVFTVRQVSADFRLPARLDDLLSVETRIVEIGGARLRLDQRICRDGTLLAALDMVDRLCRRGRPPAPDSAGAAYCARRSRSILRAAINCRKDAIKGRHQCNRYRPQHLPGTCPPSLSMFDLFLQSDSIVKLVMLILLVASFWSWAVIFDKVLRLRRLQQAASSFEDTFWSGGSLDDLYDRVGQRPIDPMSAVFAAAMREWRRSAAKGLLGTPGMRSSLQQRIERVMNVTVGREMDRVERFMSFLATVGSTAPFVGLFGTVWGIMNSFQAIAASKNTSLAVVAPGIAEALFATALGLVAAIPAVVAYNKLATDFGRYAGRLEGFATEFSAILSRQLDERQ